MSEYDNIGNDSNDQEQKTGFDQMPNTGFDPNVMPNYSVEPGQQGGGNGKSIASLVLGICGFLGCCIPIVGVICGIVGLSLGVKAKNENPNSMATAGIVLSIITLVLSVINWIAGIFLNLRGMNPLV